MKIDKEHILFRVLTFLLVITLLVPSAVKIIHVFEHHEHEVCISENSTHIHKIDLDCEFQKFHITTYALLTPNVNQAELVEYLHEIPVLTYKFLNNHRPLSFSLRGPPTLV